MGGDGMMACSCDCKVDMFKYKSFSYTFHMQIVSQISLSLLFYRESVIDDDDHDKFFDVNLTLV